MGYMFDRHCYPDAESARVAFASAVPHFDGTAITTLNSVSVNSSGLLTWSIAHRPLTSTAVSTRTGTTQLPACSTPDLSNYSEQSLVFVFALFFAAVLGFKTGFNSYI